MLHKKTQLYVTCLVSSMCYSSILMKLGGSLGNKPQNRKNFYKNSIYFGLLVHFQMDFKFTLENGLTV
jgi:hypothetical protein